MCGIAGYYKISGVTEQSNTIISMIRALRHRGPDDEGMTLINTNTGELVNLSSRESVSTIRDIYTEIETFSTTVFHDIAIAHCRFSIIDLTAGGHQPMWHHTEKVCISFNGEIYNYIEIKEELSNLGYIFNSESDTEVLLSGYIEWGTDVFKKLNGFWALAIYDGKLNRLLLSRDRMGKAPLYYTIFNNTFYWSSEIKSFFSIKNPSEFKVRDQAIDDYILLNLRDFNGTFWEDINDFPASSFAWIDQPNSISFHQFWSVPQRRYRPDDISIEDASITLRNLLLNAVQIRLRSDVPVAFELSGGMDSSSLLALCANNTQYPIAAYTVEFSDPKYNEEPYARSVVNRYRNKVDYHILKPMNVDFWQDSNEFIYFEEEPFHSPNLSTNRQLRNRINEHGIKVIINGGAGDELFAGYSSDYFIPFLLHLKNNGLYSIFLKEMLNNKEYPVADSVVNFIYNLISNKIAKKIKWRYTALSSIYRRPIDIQDREKQSFDFTHRMLENIAERKMNYWLRSGNKASMSIPVEARLPFLDFRVVDFAFSLPPEYLIRNGWHKWLLRHSMTSFLPNDVLWRKRKMGFPFPIKEWLSFSKSTVKNNIHDLNIPYVDTNKLLSSYDELMEYRPDQLWRLICICLWWRRMIDNRSIIL